MEQHTKHETRRTARRQALALLAFGLATLLWAALGAAPANRLLIGLSLVAAVLVLAGGELHAAVTRRREIDRALRAGRTQAVLPGLEQRVQKLTSQRSRRDLARSLRRWAAPPRPNPRSPLLTPTTVRDPRVRGQLIELADTIERSPSLPAQAAVRIEEFLRYPETLLYASQAELALRELGALKHLVARGAQPAASSCPVK
jgi:hypothetical protein